MNRLRHGTDSAKARFLGMNQFTAVLKITVSLLPDQWQVGSSSCRGERPARNGPDCDTRHEGREEKRDASTIDGSVSADGPRPRFTIESGVSLQRRTPGGLSIHDRGESSEAGAGGGVRADREAAVDREGEEAEVVGRLAQRRRRDLKRGEG